MLKTIESKIQEMLDTEQKGKKTRLLDKEDVIKKAEQVEMELKNLPNWTYKYLAYFYHENVANSYRASAEGTNLYFKFNSKGEINKVEISRRYVSHTPGGYSTSRLSINIEEALIKEFGVEGNESEEYRKLRSYILKSIGFNSSSNKDI